MAKAKEEVMVVESAEVPAWLKDKMDDTRGNENVTKDDLVIPRLGLIQAISPEIKKNDPNYIEGAEQGMLFNTVTRELYESAVVCPVLFEKQWLVWKDRKEGGGFGGQFDSEEEAVEYIGTLEDPDDWEVTGTPTHLCYIVGADGKASEIAIPMPISKARISRQWNSLIRMLGGPRFGRVYKITGIEDKNPAGEDYWNMKVEQAGYPSEALFKAAEKLYEDVSSGEIKYKMDTDDDGNTPDNDNVGPF